MIIVKQKDYDNFKCIAGNCPRSCCIGWQIVIDEESLEKYKSYQGEFLNRMVASIDFTEECFRQKKKRCAMLNEDGLCDLQIACGEESLCYTCRMFPRHMEEFENVREYSLSMSCPEVARLVVNQVEPMRFEEIENDKEEEEDYEDFDFLLYDRLVEARTKIFECLQNRELPLEARMEMVLEYSRKLQDCIERDEIFEMDEIEIDKKEFDDYHLGEIANSFAFLYKLERLSDDWDELLDLTIKENRKVDFSRLSAQEQIAAEQMLMLFFYTYFCGAVYDDLIYGKAGLSVYSVYWILMIYQASTREQNLAMLAEILYRYAREVEHSDLNLEAMDAFFE